MLDSRVADLFPSPQPALARNDRMVCTVVIDAEESFDWLRPTEGSAYSTTNLFDLTVLHDILDAYGAMPAYMLTYPVLMDRDSSRSLRRQMELGRCVLGLQLHTWVTPPLNGELRHDFSYSNNLPSEMEEEKLLSLKAAFVNAFGFEPIAFRGGRYGFGRRTALLLEKHGFTLDVSIAPRTSFVNEGGPDYVDFDCSPFWFGSQRRLLELPLCRSIVGWGGNAATDLYRALSSPWANQARLSSILTRSHCAERITLSPEGNDLKAARRLARGLQRRGQFMLALSFHSSSMMAGGSPYVQSRADLHTFYDRLSGMLDYLASDLDCQFTDLLHVTDYLMPPDPL